MGCPEESGGAAGVSPAGGFDMKERESERGAGRSDGFEQKVVT